METLLLYWLAALFSFSDTFGDPIHASWKGQNEARHLECERLSQAEANRRYPAEVPPTSMRSSTLMDIDALVCKRRIVRYGDRNDRDEVILTALTSEVSAITRQALASVDDDVNFVVDAFYPQPQVAMKIANAARHSLAESGRRVSSLAPLWAAGDAAVLSELSLQEALPVACARLKAEGTIDESDAFLALALLRPQETQLHAGICQNGSWRWLR